MTMRTEAYPHNWQGEVICSACGTEHQADHSSVRLILGDELHGEWTVANDLCDDCINNAPKLAASALKHQAGTMKGRAEELRQKAGKLEADAEELLTEAADTAGPWATFEDLSEATGVAKEYLAHEPPPEPEGWRRRCDGEEIPF